MISLVKVTVWEAGIRSCFFENTVLQPLEVRRPPRTYEEMYDTNQICSTNV